MLNEILQHKCRYSVPLDYSSRPNFAVALKIGTKTWCSPSGRDYLESKEDAARLAFRALVNKTEDELRKTLGLTERRNVQEIDDIRDVIKKLKQRIRKNCRLEQQGRLMSKAVAIYDVIDDLERCMNA